MVFHADYEIEFEIYEQKEGDWRSKLLGHMVGTDATEAKLRWVENHPDVSRRLHKIYALFSYDEWK
jgi:hypothetical protein